MQTVFELQLDVELLHLKQKRKALVIPLYTVEWQANMW